MSRGVFDLPRDSGVSMVQVDEEVRRAVDDHVVTPDPHGDRAYADGVILPEAWREVGASGEPAFQNSWANHSNTDFQGARFYKDAQGVVHLEGLVAGGTVSTATTGTIFTLPPGYRPAKRHMFSTISANAVARCDVDAGGLVRAVVASGNTSFSLSGLSFRVASA